ncbi:hypothetical protein [Streptomyces sp. NPDC005799]|uniref:hypothetical protein n=1 Tax=Streptomyces sp. NPDC005799 TaxID=3154678 RepID=UPI0033DB69F0
MVKLNRGRAADSAFSRIERITAVGAAIGALEQIVCSETLSDTGFYSWSIHQDRYEISNHLAQNLVDKLLKYPNVVALLHVRLAAAVRLAVGRPGPVEHTLLLLALAMTASAMRKRHPYGHDGSDQISQLTFAVSLLARAFPNDKVAKDTCLRFIAFHTSLSYAVSGAVKLVSPVWRDGSAISGIFRTRAYGDPSMHNLLREHPNLAPMLAWAVIVGELSFPLVLVARAPIAKGILAMSLAFHLVNGRLMGLNRFVWAFAGTYPAVSYAARSMRS